MTYIVYKVSSLQSRYKVESSTQKFVKHAMDAMFTKTDWIKSGSVTVNFAIVYRIPA